VECGALTDWLQAIGGLGAFLAAVVLAALAYGQVKATKDASRAQLRPLVYAHEKRGVRYGPIKADAYGKDEVGVVASFSYYLSNEGLGPALNIEHGVEVGERQHLLGNGEAGFQYRTCQAGEFLPPLPPNSTHRVPAQGILLEIPNAEFWTGGLDRENPPTEIVYFCRYESLFGERWETRNSSNPAKPPEIKRVP
jgi:hypothetical protein